MAFCQDSWSDDADPELLSQLAVSTYELGSFGWGEEDYLPDASAPSVGIGVTTRTSSWTCLPNARRASVSDGGKRLGFVPRRGVGDHGLSSAAPRLHS